VLRHRVFLCFLPFRKTTKLKRIQIMSDPATEKDAQGAQDLQALSIAAFVQLLAKLISGLANQEVKMDDLVLMSGKNKVFPSDEPQYDLIAKLKDAVIDPDKKASFRIFLEYPDGKREEVCRQTAGKVLHDPLGIIPSLRAMIDQDAISRFTRDNTPKIVVESDPLDEGEKTTLQEAKTKLQPEPTTQLQTAPVQTQPKTGNGQKSGVKTKLEMLPDFAPTSIEDDQPIVDDAWADLSEDDAAQTIEAQVVPDGTSQDVLEAEMVEPQPFYDGEDLDDADHFFDGEVDAIALEVPSPDLIALSYSVYEAEMAMQSRERELIEDLIDPLDDANYLDLKARAETLENEWNSTYEALEGNNPPQEAPLISASVPVAEKSSQERLNDYIQMALRERQESGLVAQEQNERSLLDAVSTPNTEAQTVGLLAIADRIEQNTVTLADLDRSIKADGLNPLRDEGYMALLNDTTALIGEWDAGYSRIQPQLTPSLTAAARPESNGDRLDAHIQDALIPKTALIPIDLIPPIVALEEVRNLASYDSPTVEANAVQQPDPMTADPIVVAPVDDLGVAKFQAEVTTLSSQIEHMREVANQRLGEIVLYAHDIRTQVIEPSVKDWATNTAAIVEQKAQTWGDRLRDAATQLKDVVVERAVTDWQTTKDAVLETATQFKDYAQERAVQDTQVVKEFVTAKAQDAWVDIQKNAIGAESVDKGIDTLLKYLPNAQRTDLGGIAENDGYTHATMNNSRAIFNGDGKPIYKDGLTTEHTTGKDRVYLANFPVIAEKAAQTIDAARATAIPSAAESAQSAGSGRGARR
jgi:hypothetical protein